MSLKSPDGLYVVVGALEAREGVFSHQVVDRLLCLLERVGTWRVHHTQQSLTGLCIQIDLKRRSRLSVLRDICQSHCPVLLIYHILLPTNLLRCIRVDKLAVDAAGLGLLQVWGQNPVVLTRQPELQVLLTELWTQEPTKRLQTTWWRDEWKHGEDNETGKKENLFASNSGHIFSKNVNFTSEYLLPAWDNSFKGVGK